VPEPAAAARERGGDPARDRGPPVRAHGLTEAAASRAARAAPALLVTVSLAALASLAWTFARRLAYPFDLEWMEGSMLLHALRIREGLPMYAPPSVRFASFAYVPLQPALVAAVSVPSGLSYATGRAVSIVAYLAALACAYGFLREIDVPRPLALAAPALSAAAFAPCGAWYDLVRIDSVWLGLMAGALWAAWRARRSTPAAIACGVLLTAALFAKQTALPFIGIAVLLLLLASPRRGLIAGATTAVVSLAAFLALQRATGGWFWTYAFGLHQRHDFDAWLGYVLAPLRVLLILGPAVALVPLALRARGGIDRAIVAVLGVFAAAMVATIRGAGPPWGYANTFIPTAFFGGVLVALAADRVSRFGPRAAVTATLLMTASVAGAPGAFVWAADRLWPSAGLALPIGYDPRAYVPDASDRGAGEALIARLRATPGDVFVPFHPFYAWRAGKAPSLHAMNLADLNAIPGLGTPRDLVESIRSHAFALIVLDTEGEGPGAEAEAMGQFPRLAGNYEIAERIEGPRVFSGAPVRPRLLLVPRP